MSKSDELRKYKQRLYYYAKVRRKNIQKNKARRKAKKVLYLT